MSAAALIPISAPQYLCFANRRKPFLSLRNSLLIDTAAGDQTSAETPPESSAARRLILLRHAKSSWENRSLRGTHFVLSARLCLLVCASRIIEEKERVS